MAGDPTTPRPGVVLFTGDRERLARFYAGVSGLELRARDAGVTVLGTEGFELVLHDLPDEPSGSASRPRLDAWSKLFLPVRSLAEARERVVALGGRSSPPEEEWSARGFRACEAVDPDGNVVQFRERAP